MVSSSSRRKRAASQVILPQRSPPAPPGSGSLTKSNWRLGATPKKGQANYARASSIAIEQLLEDVDFLDEEDIGIDVDDDCGSPTQVPPGRGGFVPASSLPKDVPTIEDEVMSLPRVRRQLRKAAENEEVFS